jgi:hypothetical protein
VRNILENNSPDNGDFSKDELNPQLEEALMNKECTLITSS